MNWFVLLIVPLLAQAVEATPTPGSTQATLLQLLKSGGWVMIPLILTSVITLSLIFACSVCGGEPLSLADLWKRRKRSCESAITSD